MLKAISGCGERKAAVKEQLCLVTSKVPLRHWPSSLQDGDIPEQKDKGCEKPLTSRPHSNNSLPMSSTQQQSHASGSGPISLSEHPCCPTELLPTT